MCRMDKVYFVRLKIQAMFRICLFLLHACVLLTTTACQSYDKQNIGKSSRQAVFSVQPDSAWWASSGIRLQPVETGYEQVKLLVSQKRNALSAAYQKGDISLDSARKVFTLHLLNYIVPYWYGTPWSFSGYTAIPGQGSIACGYFISTTLQDAGVLLNRYRLAQQSPSGEAAILSLGDTIRVLRCGISDSTVAALKKRLRDGLYFAGMGDSHVGYLLMWHNELLLLHSNYTTPAKVVIQPLMQSVFAGYNKFYITDITYNDRLIKNWLKGSEVPTKNVAVPTFSDW